MEKKYVNVLFSKSLLLVCNMSRATPGKTEQLHPKDLADLDSSLGSINLRNADNWLPSKGTITGTWLYGIFWSQGCVVHFLVKVMQIFNVLPVHFGDICALAV